MLLEVFESEDSNFCATLSQHDVPVISAGAPQLDELGAGVSPHPVAVILALELCVTVCSDLKTELLGSMFGGLGSFEVFNPPDDELDSVHFNSDSAGVPPHEAVTLTLPPLISVCCCFGFEPFPGVLFHPAVFDPSMLLESPPFADSLLIADDAESLGFNPRSQFEFVPIIPPTHPLQLRPNLQSANCFPSH